LRKKRSTIRAKRFRCISDSGSFDASIGVNVNATSA
jgi:hypothetical protein